MKKIISLLMSAVICANLFCLPSHAQEITEYDFIPYKENSWRYKDGQPVDDPYAVSLIYEASHPDATFTGVDVSHHQGQINWEKVKADGIDFAIIRCGYAEDNPEYDDRYWQYNMSECERLGIPYGVYLYSYAESVKDALSEAEHVLRLIEGCNLSMPVYWDLEDSILPMDKLEEMSIAFCGRISEAGYPVGIYANLNWWTYYLTEPCYDNWHRWVARWNESCGYDGELAIWQYYNKGVVDGISGDVDMNFLIGTPDDHKVWTEKLDTPKVTAETDKEDGYPILSWDAVSGAEKYQIWRKAAGERYVLHNTVTETEFKDTEMDADGTYSYIVKAVCDDKTKGNSCYSEEKTVEYIKMCVNPEDHTYEETVTPPTCTEQGYTTHTCTRCGDIITDNYTEKLGHTEVADPSVEPTCDETGLTAGTHCSVCGAVVVPQQVVDVLGHSFTQYIDNGDKTSTAKCDRCDATDTVFDYTPDMESDTITLNSYSEKGVELKVEAVHDSAITPDANGDCVKLIGDDNFCAEYDTEKGAVVIKSTDIVKNNSRGVKLSLLVNTDKGSYQLPLTVKVANKLPTVSVKHQGTFNSFFKDSSVISVLTSKDAEIENVVLKDTPTFAAYFTSAEGGNPAFITVGWADKSNPSSNFVNGKADTSAVLEVHFKDYRETVAVRYTVKVRETKPTLVQSRSTSKLTCFSTDNSPISVTNKLDGELIDFDTSQWQFVSDSSEYVNITTEGTNLTIRPILNDKNKFANGRTSHTVKLEICEDNWIKPVTISHTITVSTSKPVIKAKSTSATLCTLYSDNAAFVFSANPANCPALQFTVESSSRNASTVREANKIDFATDPNNPWRINAYIADSSIKTGSYLYKVTPRLAADDGRVIELKAVTIKVTVSKTAPAVKIKPTSVKLTQTKSQAAVKVTPNTSACPPPVKYDIKPVSPSANTAKIGFDYDGWDITAKIIDTSDMPAKMSYKYKITAYIEGADGSMIPLKTINFTVNVAK